MKRKLSDHDVLRIRSAYLKGDVKFGAKALAALFCVSRPVIERIIDRTTYRHLPMHMRPPLMTTAPRMVGYVYLNAGGVDKAGPGQTPDYMEQALDRYNNPVWDRVDAPIVQPTQSITARIAESDAKDVRASIERWAKEHRESRGIDEAVTAPKKRAYRSKKRRQRNENGRFMVRTMETTAPKGPKGKV